MSLFNATVGILVQEVEKLCQLHLICYLTTQLKDPFIWRFHPWNGFRLHKQVECNDHICSAIDVLNCSGKWLQYQVQNSHCCIEQWHTLGGGILECKPNILSTLRFHMNTFQEYIHDLKAQKAGKAWHIIATVEQLFKTPEGHLLHLAILVCDPQFQKQIKSVTVDEAHFIHLAGIPHYGNSAFRPAWGRLDKLKVILPKTVPWWALSAMFPPHILKTVKEKILQWQCFWSQWAPPFANSGTKAIYSTKMQVTTCILPKIWLASARLTHHCMAQVSKCKRSIMQCSNNVRYPFFHVTCPTCLCTTKIDTLWWWHCQNIGWNYWIGWRMGSIISWGDFDLW